MADRAEANARLTGTTAAVLLVLFAVEGVTLVSVRSLLTLHVFVGMLLLPPALVKTASTTWRALGYYRGVRAYRAKGPPPLILRVLGPVVVISTAVVLASGIALMIAPSSLRPAALTLHKASFVVWFVAMTVHVLGHALDTARLAPLDWMHRSRRQIAGAGRRQWLVAASLAGGALLGVVLLGRVGPYLDHAPPHHALVRHRAYGPPAAAAFVGADRRR
ncbi:MAG TPA: hypothetical protein VG184_01460 [Acidimicrobiales bacterium]|jgi:hypothetical protein|nr:hypothetical protein [Acidimicrobiales bacterium]